MKTNYAMLKELLNVFKPEERGIISGAEAKLIKNKLHIDEMDILQLRNLRDLTVLMMSDMAAGPVEKILFENDRCSAIVSVIDSRIFVLGGEV